MPEDSELIHQTEPGQHYMQLKILISNNELKAYAVHCSMTHRFTKKTKYGRVSEFSTSHQTIKFFSTPPKLLAFSFHSSNTWHLKLYYQESYHFVL